MDHEHGALHRPDDPSHDVPPAAERQQRPGGLEERRPGVGVLLVADELLHVEADQLVGDRRGVGGDDAQAQLDRALGLQARDALPGRPLADAGELVQREADHHDRRRQRRAALPREDRVREHERLDRRGLERGLEHRDPAAHRVPDEHDRSSARDLVHEPRHGAPEVADAAAAAVALGPAEAREVHREHPPVPRETRRHREPRQQRPAQPVDEHERAPGRPVPLDVVHGTVQVREPAGWHLDLHRVRRPPTAILYTRGHGDRPTAAPAPRAGRGPSRGVRRGRHGGRRAARARTIAPAARRLDPRRPRAGPPARRGVPRWRTRRRRRPRRERGPPRGDRRRLRWGRDGAPGRDEEGPVRAARRSRGRDGRRGSRVPGQLGRVRDPRPPDGPVLRERHPRAVRAAGLPGGRPDRRLGAGGGSPVPRGDGHDPGPHLGDHARRARRRPVRRGRPRRAVREPRRRGDLGAQPAALGSAEPARLGARGRRPVPALDLSVAGRTRPPRGRHLLGRRVDHRGRGASWESATRASSRGTCRRRRAPRAARPLRPQHAPVAAPARTPLHAVPRRRLPLRRRRRARGPASPRACRATSGSRWSSIRTTRMPPT